MRDILKIEKKKWEKVLEHLRSLSPDEFAKPDIQDQYAEALFRFNYINGKQNALKVMMNTFYGEAGNARSSIRELLVAGGTTTTGVDYIKATASKVVDDLMCRQYYGDSVTGYTPILVRHKSKFGEQIETFDRFNLKWKKASNTYKEIASMDDWQVWSSDGWTDIQQVIRHKTDKKIYRIATKIGIVDATEDHSLLLKNLKEIKPSECKVGTELYHLYPYPASIMISTNQTKKYNTQYEAAKHYYICKSVGVECYISCQGNTYTIEMSPETVHNPNAITSITEIPYNGYVYDLTTKSNTFQAGIGSMIVHNTDSIYLSMPDSNFDDLDKLYYGGEIAKMDYMEKVVLKSFQVIVSVNKTVNDFLINRSKGKFLKMAYEEFLYPTGMFGKKKYDGVDHIGVFNKYPKKYFIKGLDLVKKGVSKLLVDASMTVISRSLAYDNTDTLLTIVESVIENIYTTKHAFEDFIRTDTYKPKKLNVKVQTFASRMREIDLGLSVS